MSRKDPFDSPMTPATPSAGNEQPALTLPPVWKQARWGILGLLFSITVINFIDRQSLSVVAPLLRESLGLSNTQYGIIVSGFLVGMMVGEFPMGWLMDRRGVRFGLTFAVLWWSLANGLHALGRSMVQFTLLRFWLGTGECGNYSGGMKIVSQWFPARERAFAIGVFNAGSMTGAVIAPPLLVWVTLRMGWHSAFLLPAVLGIFWVVAWRLFYRAPEEHPRITAAELAYIRSDKEAAGSVPGNLQLLRLRQTWALMLCRMLVGPVVQFYVFWMPEYLYRERGLSLTAIGMFAWVPFLFGDLGSIGGGWFAGFLMRKGLSVTAARRVSMLIGAAMCLLSLAVAKSGTAFVAMAFICVVLLGHFFLSANMFAAISDLFPNHAVGRVTALTGVAGGLSGMLFPLLTGFLVDHFSYLPVFSLAALMPLAGTLVLFAGSGRLRRLNLEVEGKPLKS